MNIRRSAAAALAGLALAGAAHLAPATAAVSDGGTVVTYELDGSTLAITGPADPAAVTGSVAALSQVTSELGTTTVTDNTGSLLGWTVTAAATDLTKSDDAAIKIGKGFMRYDTLTLTAADGGSLVSTLDSTAIVAKGAGGPFAVDGVDAPVVVATAAPLAGAGSYDITGKVTLTVPPSAYAGTYTATVTQTVT